MLTLLINDILDYSQIQYKSKPLKVREEQFNLKQVFRDINDIFEG